ncbi:MAG: class I SAM-dependent DNA methyltransferase [Phaeodactylibacter xiamenensis]|uniref:site-specific DNA-methyltransferase (adenine-specific) n=2 Tax=Phaeodactylibacter xiamenensis TaxID=1524460 RepID=A0A098SE32_9BACT|nr:DNA methyltransferase [Phaeodactylibacter xiamenensis]KGE89287.1 lactate dehydrogenase [Phaeodactylibacter xiamenensis]
MNAVEIEEAVSQLVSQPFDPDEFPFAFLEAYGNKETTVKRLRKGNSNKSKMEGGVLQRNNIHIATCEPGAVADTLRQLQEAPETAKNKAKFVLATDGEELQAENLNSGETLACAYPDFHQHFTFFFELAGISTVKEIRESSFDIKATGRLNKLYMELLRANPDWATPERKQDMNHFMARLIFCFFAEDTNIFEGDNLFTGTVEQMSAPDASNMHEIIGELFRAMDVKAEEREAQGIRTWARKFPYVNGELFSGATDCPRFTKIARSYLLHVGRLDWQQINPDIFGSMIQAVADEDERGSLGMHYTSVPNILKVLNPLFLDELREQLEEAGDNPRKLLNLRKRIARIRVFDPACGSGNFLVIAYKQLREIEHEINRRRGEPDRPTEIPLTNFRGIEIKGFSAEIARLALIIAEYQCDVLYLGQQLALAEFLPLDAENWITCGNALRINWLTVCPPTGTGVELGGDDLFSTPLQQAQIDFENEGGETFICGNPPYLGSTWQSKEQKSDLKEIFAKYTKTWKSLDYVAGWFMKAAEYGTQTNAASAFVSTNSICQGQQVPILWPLIFKKKHEISFAHTSFKWANLASYNAGVTVVIVGISRQPNKVRRLFSFDEQNETIEKKAENINAYLVPASNIIVKKSSTVQDSRGIIEAGGKPVEGGNLLFDAEEARRIIDVDYRAIQFIKRVYGSSEFIKGDVRYCVWVSDENKSLASEIADFQDRFRAVAQKRLGSPKAATNRGAEWPHRFEEVKQLGDEQIIIMPKVSSESREFLPVGILPKGSIITDLAFGMFDAPLWNLALIASKLHLVWIATVCGQLETRIRYSNTLGWNTFPVPKLTTKNKEDLTRCAEDILLARERHFPATIADLYDPEKMPEDLRHAHERNDEVLERIYIGRRFKNDTERLEKLFELYTEMTAKKDRP